MGEEVPGNKKEWKRERIGIALAEMFKWSPSEGDDSEKGRRERKANRGMEHKWLSPVISYLDTSLKKTLKKLVYQILVY